MSTEPTSTSATAINAELSDIPPTACPYAKCTERFTIKRTLDAHIREHLNARNHICRYPPCTAAFKTGTTRRQHELACHHGKKYHCKWPQCTFISGRRDKVVDHVNGKHFKIPVAVHEQVSLGKIAELDVGDFIKQVLTEPPKPAPRLKKI